MAVLTKEQFTKAISDILGERTDDACLSFIENATETFDHLNQGGDTASLQKQLDDAKADAEAVRKKYRDRFLNGDNNHEPDPDPGPDPDPEDRANTVTFDDLFTEVE